MPSQVFRRRQFANEAMVPRNPKYKDATYRDSPLYLKHHDIRSPFARDYTRILHCTAYRRLKHKTQVFFAPSNDHVCTRIEHVNHVTSVSFTIANYLGLDTELTNAIAVGHDLGHPPFGHAGETFLKSISERELHKTFWHEKNSLRFVDDIETLENDQGAHQNLQLTYAVRDGIVCHCGEVDEQAISPRQENLRLERIGGPSIYSPYTWEGCVVKVADKIAYIGRDIEDAIALKILTISQAKELVTIVRRFTGDKVRQVSNTLLMHQFITDLCQSSNPREGIRVSPNGLEILKSLKQFSIENIYNHKRLSTYQLYAKLVIEAVFSTLRDLYRGVDTLDEIEKHRRLYPSLVEFFSEWLRKYAYENERDNNKFCNKILYDIKKEDDYMQAIVDFISGMTDTFAIRLFNEITTF